MGESFLRKKNRQFIRLVDERIDDVKCPDLFRDLPPDERVVLTVGVEPDCELQVGEGVWAPLSEASSGLEIYRGKSKVASSLGDASAALAREYLPDGMVTMTVLEVANGVAQLGAKAERRK